MDNATGVAQTPVEPTAAAPAPQPVRFLRRNRGHIFKVGIELLAVFIGVTAAFALDNWRSEAAEESYRRQMITSLSTSIDLLAAHNDDIMKLIDERVDAFDAALAKGERPAPPVYREEGGERPPTKAWDGIVATGVAKSVPPGLYFELSEYFNRLDAFGDRYMRYAEQTELDVLPKIDGENTSAFYTADGKLRGEYREYVNRLREIRAHCDLLFANAKSLREKLAAALK